MRFDKFCHTNTSKLSVSTVEINEVRFITAGCNLYARVCTSNSHLNSKVGVTSCEHGNKDAFPSEEIHLASSREIDTSRIEVNQARCDASWLRTRALRRPAGLEQLRVLPLAPPSTNDRNSTLLAWTYAIFHALFSGINAAAFPVLIWLFSRPPPGSRRIMSYSVSCNNLLRILRNPSSQRLMLSIL